MEILKKTFKQILTTGATTDQRAGYFLIIPDTGVTYSMKVVLTADVTDIGFLDPVDSITGDTIYYEIIYNDYHCCKKNQIDTITYDILYTNYGCVIVDIPTTTVFVPTTTIFGYTTTAYVPTTTAYVPTTTVYVPTTTEFGYTTT